MLARPDETVRINPPAAFEPLWHPVRYKGAHGGRGSGKSHFFAEMLIVRCFAKPTRAACIREVQASIKDSVKQLLVDKIQSMGLGYFFDVLETEIRGQNGSLIVFKGMQSFNAENIKSLEGYDIAWAEEAQTLSALSLELLRPTIRKDQNGDIDVDESELWFSWNPRHDTDEVDKFFRGEYKRKNMACVEINWEDNPYFPEVLREERDEDYQADPEKAEHVWGGGYRIISEGAYYAKLLHAADKDGRIGSFPYSPARKVRTGWDIGVDDHTAIWFFQDDGTKIYIIDFFEFSGEGPQTIVPQCMPELNPDIMAAAAQMIEIGRQEPFLYGEHFLPHDVKNREWGAGAKERSLTLMEKGVKPLRVGVATNPANRIDAVRKILPVCYFNDTPRVQQGLRRLRRYSRRFNDSMQTYTTPLKDGNDHAADAFGEFAINCRIEPAAIAKPRPKAQPTGTIPIGPPEPKKPTRISFR